MLNEIKQFFDFLISPRLCTLNQKELNHQYHKHRAMKYMFTVLSFIIFLFAINGMFSMLNTMNGLGTVEIKFYTGLTVFTVFIIAGLMISSELKLESTMKYIIRNQIDIVHLLKNKQYHCERLDELAKKMKEKNLLFDTAYKISKEEKQ